MPTFRIGEPLPSKQFAANCVDYVRGVVRWRNRVLTALNDEDEASKKYGFSARSRLSLLSFLQSGSPLLDKLRGAGSPYNVQAFPEEEIVTGGVQSAMAILRWRAGFVDYLSDVWDVMGEPALDLDECELVQRFLFSSSPESLCMFCLTHFEGNLVDPNRHPCVILSDVRAKWPPNPFDPDGKWS